MKKLLFFLMATIFAIQVWSQTILSEGFEKTTFPPEDWMVLNTLGSSTPWIRSTSYSHTGSACAFTNYNLTGSINYMITPKLVINSLTDSISFWARMDVFPSSYNQTFLKILVSNTDNNVSSFDTTTLLHLSPSFASPNDQITNVWKKWTISLEDYIGQEIYIAFRQTDNDGYGLCIDDIVGPTLFVPTCPKPKNILASNITSTSLDLTWDIGNNSQWIVDYKLSTDSTWVSALATTNSYSFINLSPHTNYDFRVASICSSDTSMFLNKSFMTPCTPITTLPFIENFNSYPDMSFPSCWYRPIIFFDSYSYQNFPAVDTYWGTQTSMMIASGDNVPTYVISPQLAFNINALRVKFMLQAEDVIYSGSITVGLMSDPNNISTFDSIQTVQPTNTNFTQCEVSFTNASLTGPNRFVAFRHNPINSSSFAYYYWLDDVIIDSIPACAKPTNLVISNISTTTADLSWTSGNPNDASWWLYTKLSSATIYDSILITASSPYTISNLLPSSEYNYYMKTNCTTEVSEPTQVYSFYTACVPISTFPWLEGFESNWLPMTGISNSANPTNCWININGGLSTSYLWRKTTSTGIAYIRTGSGSAQLYGYNQSMGDYLITPTLTLTGNQKIVFWAKGYSSTTVRPENLWVKAFDVTTNGDIDSFSDTTLMTNIGFINDTNQYTWKEYEFPLTGLVGDYRLVFARDNNVGYYYHIDDLKVDNQGACPRPTAVIVTNIQQTQADISWTPGTVTDNAWKIYYRQLGSTLWDSVYTTINPFTLYGLSPTTAYEFSVNTDCGTGAFSDGRDGTFRTACGAISSLPFADNFDTYGTGTSVMPTCWIRNTNYTNPRPYVSTGGFSGNCLYFYTGSVGTYAMAITPEFDQSIDMSSLILNFKFKSYAAANDTLRIGVMTDTTAASFVEVGKVFGPTSWNDYQVSLASYTGTGKYIGFRVNYGPSDTYSYVDNLVVTTNCTSPTSLTTTGITQTSATVNWTAGGSETSWEVKLGAAGATTMVTSPTYTFTGLTTATQYTAYVRANCGTSNSAWMPVTFTTDSTPLTAVVTTAPVTTFTYNTASFVGSYTPGADTINTVGFEYKTTAATSWTNQAVSPVASPFSYNATGLTPSTQYKVRAYVTKQGGVNVYGDTMTFTTAIFSLPVVVTDSIEVLNNSSAKFYGSITTGTEQIVARGFEFKTAAQTWTSAQDLTATGTNSITATATGLDSTTTYNVRAYAETATGKVYGDEKNFVTSSGLNDVEINSMSVSLYPNPASTTSTLVVKGLVGNAKVIITDLQGRTINTFDVKSVNGEAIKSINVNNYAKGVYYVRILNSKIVNTQKLIVE